jgi:hypothetical protein
MPRLRMPHCGLSLAAYFCALLGAGCAGPSPEGSFIRAAGTWDLNRDGKVTCEEFRTYAASLFKEADRDHDGKLTREEFAKLAKIDKLFGVVNFDSYDVNKQGYVTQADFVNRPNPTFTVLDRDKSCVIDRASARVDECELLYPDITQALSRRNCRAARSEPEPSSSGAGGLRVIFGFGFG